MVWRRFAVTALLAVSVMVVSAPAANAHGENGPRTLTEDRTVGNHAVTVWSDDVFDEQGRVGVVVEVSSYTQAADTDVVLAVREPDGTEFAVGPMASAGYGRFSSRVPVGSDTTLVVRISDASGRIDEIAMPYQPGATMWMKAALVAGLVLGLTMAGWLAARTRRTWLPDNSFTRTGLEGATSS